MGERGRVRCITFITHAHKHTRARAHTHTHITTHLTLLTTSLYTCSIESAGAETSSELVCPFAVGTPDWMRCKETPWRSREDGRRVSAWLLSPTKAGLLLDSLEVSSPGGGVGGVSQCWMVMRDLLGMELGRRGRLGDHSAISVNK